MAGIVSSNFRVQYQWDDTSGPGLTWTTISDNFVGFKLNRDHKKAGTIECAVNMDVLDPSLHPLNDQHIRKGQLARAQVLVSGTWRNIFTGTIQRVDVTFASTATSVAGVRTVNFVAHDHHHKRKHKPHSHGVGKVDDLRAFIDTPFSIDGQTTTKSATGINDFTNDTTTEWDQIQITRDTQGAFAWIDKDDILHVESRSFKSTTNRASITASNYSKVDLNYTLENVINVVVVKEIQKYNNGKTHVVHKNVFERSASITKYGRHRAVYTVQDHLNTWADDAAFANNILDKNALPATVPTGCAIPIVTTSDVSNFLDNIDVLDRVTITVDGTVYAVRVDTILVEATPAMLGVAFTFSHQDIIHKPQKKSHQTYQDAKVITGNGHIADGTVQTSLLEDGAVTTGKIADGAVTIAKVPTTFFTDIGGHGFTTSGSAPSSPVTGDYWVDTGNGNILKRWNGSAWVSIQDSAIGTAQTTANTAITNAAAAQSTANTALTTANGKNTVTYSTSTPGTTANTAGDIWYQQDGSQKIIGQWTGAGGTSWTSVTLRNEVIATLDAGKITTGSLSAARIATQSLDVTKLFVANMSNQIDDPGFEMSSGSWVLGTGCTISTIADPANGGTKVGRIPTLTGNTPGIQNNPGGNGFPVIPGDDYFFFHRLRKTTTGTTGAIRTLVRFTLDGGSTQDVTVVDTNLSSLTQNVWTTVSGIVAVPASKNFAQPRVHSQVVATGDTVEVDDWVFRKAVETNMVVDGTITAQKVAAGAITASALAVTVGGGNLQPNSSVETTPAAGAGTYGTSTRYSFDTAVFHTGTRSVKIAPLAGDTGFIGWQQEYVPLTGAVGNKYTGSAFYYRDAGTGPIRLNLQFLDASNAQVGSVTVDSPNTTLTTWQRLSVTGTAPANTAKARLISHYVTYTGGTDVCHFDSYQVEAGDVLTAWAPKVDEILPGTIVASMISAGTITANEIAANAIVAGKIAAGAIDGLTMTAGVFQTASVAPRLIISSSGSQEFLQFWTGSSGETAPGTIQTLGSWAIQVNSPRRSTSPATLTYMTVSDMGITASIPTLGQGGSFHIINGPVNIDNSLSAGSLQVQGTIDNWSDAGNTGHARSIEGDILKTITPNTTTNAANARINTVGGAILLVTSLSKFKLDQKKIDLGEAEKLLNLTGLTWIDKTDYEENGKKMKGLHRTAGVTSEDVEQHVPDLASYRMKDGKEELLGVDYERMAVYLLPLVSDQRQRIEKLEKQVAELTKG